ncbi:MAG: nucleoside triphosphate pyrophosphohydrolase [Polyangiales bacterium]
MPELIRFRVEKLIRDRLPELMRSWGLRVTTRQLDPAELIACLRAKLQEEAAEVQQAPSRAALLEELADVTEVVQALCEVSGITPLELEACRLAKQRERGGFAAGVYSVEVAAEVGAAAADYYLARPSTYPRIEE